MGVRLTERSLYPIIIDAFNDVARKYGITISGVQEVGLPNRSFPDILFQIDGFRVLVQVKIDTEEKILDDIAKTYPLARQLGYDLIGILFPKDVRQIRPEDLKKVFGSLRVSRGLILTTWQGADLEDITLSELAEAVIRSFVEYRQAKIPLPQIDYLTIARVARETIEELAQILRELSGIKQYFDAALAIIGSFDYYRAMLEDFLNEEEMRIYVADITAYLLVLQLLFLHVISKRIYNRTILPEIQNPLDPGEYRDFVDKLYINIINSGRDILDNYRKVLGSLLHILDILRALKILNEKSYLGINQVLAKYVYTFYPLRPEHVREELFGRIYQFGLPPETRKNLGAFFTKPQAAKLLASLAIEKWDDKVLDPACGSGTLLAEAYQAKLRKAKEQGVNIPEDELHKLFLEKHIVGIDIMQFAKELTTINLALQNPFVRAEPRVFAGDGIEKMVHAEKVVNDDPASGSIEKYLREAQEEYEKLALPREGFDVVIMNPPFTRWEERIPESEKEKLVRLLGNIVSGGRIGYWAFFFVAADNIVRPGGRLAAVTPEEFFSGRTARSVREYLLGKRGYELRYVVRSAVETAFSEGAHYRDYLVVLEKGSGQARDYLVFIILKKRIEELTDNDVVSLTNYIKTLGQGGHYPSDVFDVVFIRNISRFIGRFVDNLKPIVGFNSINAQKLFLELLDSIGSYPKLTDVAEIITYWPGKYRGRGEGVEDYARRLFIARYGAKGKISFRLVSEGEGNVVINIRNTKIERSIDKRYLVPSLRTTSNVRHFDITNESEFAIADEHALSDDDWRLAGLNDGRRRRSATYDVREAYRDKASRILITYRVRITSPNVYWLVFHANYPVIYTATTLGLRLRGTVANDIGDSLKYEKLLTLYLNSAFTLLQLLAYHVETEGAWIRLDTDRVWSNVIVPSIHNLRAELVSRALALYDEVSKRDVNPLYVRIKTNDPVQRRIDELAIDILGLGNEWKSRLNELYKAISEEFEYMQRILESSRGAGRRRDVEEEDYEEKEGTSLIRRLDEFFG